MYRFLLYTFYLNVQFDPSLGPLRLFSANSTFDDNYDPSDADHTQSTIAGNGTFYVDHRKKRLFLLFFSSFFFISSWLLQADVSIHPYSYHCYCHSQEAGLCHLVLFVHHSMHRWAFISIFSSTFWWFALTGDLPWLVMFLPAWRVSVLPLRASTKWFWRRTKSWQPSRLPSGWALVHIWNFPLIPGV